jgi:hypothetical protein
MCPSTGNPFERETQLIHITCVCEKRVYKEGGTSSRKLCKAQPIRKSNRFVHEPIHRREEADWWFYLLALDLGHKTGSLSRLRVIKRSTARTFAVESIYLTRYIAKVHASTRNPTNSWLSWLFHLFLLIRNDVIISLTQSKYPRLVRNEQMKMGSKMK